MLKTWLRRKQKLALPLRYLGEGATQARKRNKKGLRAGESTREQNNLENNNNNDNSLCG